MIANNDEALADFDFENGEKPKLRYEHITDHKRTSISVPLTMIFF